jgi:hypothetical protein
MFEDQDYALCMELPILVKAKTEGDKRIVEVEASNEQVDTEGDVIEQKSLLDAGAGFCATGHLDIDHLSEIGERLGIRNPSQYIVGVPLEVKDLGKGRTGVRGELNKSAKAEELWAGLTMDPPVRWRASIYGFPKAGMIDDMRVSKGPNPTGAKRYVVKGINWRSLAFTRNPINDSITGNAHIVTAKAMMAIMKARLGPDALAAIEKGPYASDMVGGPVNPMDFILPPRNREELMGHFHYQMKGNRSPYANPDLGYSVSNFQNHFQYVCGCASWEADLLANALMNLLKRERRDN